MGKFLVVIAHGGQRFEREKRMQPSQRESFCWRFMFNTGPT
jgi:hypothetical protein